TDRPPAGLAARTDRPPAAGLAAPTDRPPAAGLAATTDRPPPAGLAARTDQPPAGRTGPPAILRTAPRLPLTEALPSPARTAAPTISTPVVSGRVLRLRMARERISVTAAM